MAIPPEGRVISTPILGSLLNESLNAVLGNWPQNWRPSCSAARETALNQLGEHWSGQHVVISFSNSVQILLCCLVEPALRSIVPMATQQQPSVCDCS
ncbi:hypothetical protein OCU04_005588 [Sclerotinia nivalis]|uniref:Uncharacterized protein n=1 Tax=Sclerotinia nivalis TaxID=352851 RepID=A0A9X0APH2_9HELO|nr:hypothetical protein OCU04_005588 [Sclerotinia nivalis]